MDNQQRILAIDFGTKRIGLALSDPLGIIASGLGTIPNDAATFKELQRIFETHAVGKIIIGMPYTMKGEEGISAERVRAFIQELQSKTDIPVETVDERFTSVMASNTIHQLGVGKKKREKNKGKIDELSAVHLLQGYLQSLPSGL